ncbi:hypothetical protein UFOVP817_14 [uncultured Caudovirales phage]|uniref:Carbohydrate-binding module family 5/12 n=1 Tax=uncultured Caudovirales phage TaxID=2100421 RepID=A0A6J5NZF3_9CAUD|nr:hypothetical protein UFOVP817_14 [uncultured Caudovirales phage]
MPQFQTIKAVFNGGEMSPLMDGRTDSEKYATGCRILENFIVRSYGGAFKRPGTRFGAANSDVTGCVRLIPFRRSTSINFVLGFKTNAIKVWSYSSGAFTLVTTLTTTYSESEIMDLHFCQLNDVMHLTVGTEHPKIITRATDGTWSIIDTPFQFAPALDPPDDAVTMMLDYDADDWVANKSPQYAIGDFVLYLNDLYRCKTANGDASFTLAKWDKAVYRSSWNVNSAATSYTAGDVVEYFGSNYFCITTHGPATSANRPGVGAQWVLINITDYRLIASSATFDANEVGSIWLLSPGSTNRVASETVPAAAATTTSGTIFIQGSYLARTNWTSGQSPATTLFQLQESLDRMNFTTIKEWYINGAQEGTISYTADAPNTGGWYRWVATKTTGTANTSTMTIEPAVGKVDIPFKIESYVSTTQVRGIPKLAVDSLIPNEVIGMTFPVWRKGAFSVTRGYPRTVTFHDSRLWYASTATEPTRIWGSQTDDFYTFLTGSLDTSGIDVTLAATQANDIQWIASFKRTMVIGTTGEEWTMDSGDQDNALTPSSVRLRRWSRYGSSKHQPILSGDGLLWLTRDNRLREFAYVFERDGYSAPEMTLLAEHIPSRSNVVQVAYSQSPDPIVWLVHADGAWSGFTYDRENNVTAWHRHTTGFGGEHDVLSICTLYSDSTAADSLIYLTKRGTVNQLESIDGAVMQAAMTSANTTFSGLESDVVLSGRMCVFMDSYYYGTFSRSGTTVSFTGVTTAVPAFITGTELSLGINVADSSAGAAFYASVTSGAGGSLAFTNVSGVSFLGGTKFPVGIIYEARLMPNRIEVQLQDGSAQMRQWRVTRMAFRVFNSIILHCYESSVDAYLSSNQVLFDDADSYGGLVGGASPGFINGQTRPQPFNFDWGHGNKFIIGSRHPVPCNVLAALIEIQVEGSSGAGGR